MSIRPIRFFHRGQIVEVADAAPTRSVLDWLREDARCNGTKGDKRQAMISEAIRIHRDKVNAIVPADEYTRFWYYTMN